MAVNLGKAAKVLDKVFVDSNSDISEDRASELVVNSEMRVKELKEEMESDDKLQAAKSIVKDLGSAYRDAIKYEEAKIQWLLGKIKEIRGEDEE